MSSVTTKKEIKNFFIFMDFRGALEIKITFFLKFLILFKILIVSGNNFIPLCVTPNKSKKKIS